MSSPCSGAGCLGGHLLQDRHQTRDASQVAVLMVARTPGSTVTDVHTGRQRRRLSKVDHPHGGT